MTDFDVVQGVCVCVCVCVCVLLFIFSCFGVLCCSCFGLFSFGFEGNEIVRLSLLFDPHSGAEGGGNAPLSWMPTAVKPEEELEEESEEEEEEEEEEAEAYCAACYRSTYQELLVICEEQNLSTLKVSTCPDTGRTCSLVLSAGIPLFDFYNVYIKETMSWS